MQYKISHEVYLEIIVDAPSREEAEALANRTPYGKWEERYVVREDCVALSESPINPRPA